MIKILIPTSEIKPSQSISCHLCEYGIFMDDDQVENMQTYFKENESIWEIKLNVKENTQFNDGSVL